MSEEVLHNGVPLDWKLPLNLIGEKVSHPPVHMCDICQNPIAVYGRHIPCKHVFCMECANKEPTPGRRCFKCRDTVTRSERCDLGQVYMCMSGSTNHDLACKRTYLSQRDLEAHVNHRHRRVGPSGPMKNVQTPQKPAQAEVHDSSQHTGSSRNLIMINLQQSK